MNTRTHSIVLAVSTLAIYTCAAWAQVHFYVAMNGNDSWSGRLNRPTEAKSDGPFETLIRARDAVRAVKKKSGLPDNGVQIVLDGGTYAIEQTLEFTDEDSGTKDRPISYSSSEGELVRLLGGKIVSTWTPVTNPDVLSKLDESARGQLLQADLKGLGITDLGTPNGGGLELFFNGEPMTVSRWPNEGFVRIVDVRGKTKRDTRGTRGCAEGIFEYDADRPQRWVGEKDGWVHGYWFWDWAEQRHKIKSIDVEQRIIELEPPYHGYGYRKGQWYYAFNMLSEIDQPGEWYVDRETGILYFWPPAPVDSGEALVSVLQTVMTMNDASHVSLRGFTIEGARGDAITMSGGRGNGVVGCSIRNVGGWAVTVSGGEGHCVVGCDMYQMGGGGVALHGGDREQLTPAGHFAENNHIHHYARVNRVYQPGITLQGVGNRASHNLIHDAPHMGMGFSGNDHVIELNEIHSVCYESNDAGAIYTGRDWTMRGTVIRNNYLHHISGFRGLGCVGVYLDDMFCGTEISGNLFYRVTRAAFIGGGRDCVVKNNLFVDCNPSLHIDDRALGWAHDHTDAWIREGRDKGTHKGIHFKQPPYSTRYPKLANILEDEPAAPKGNQVFRNVSYGGRWDGVYEGARKYQSIENNLVDKDPRLATPDRIGEGKQPAAVDFTLQVDSPAWEIGFEELPLDCMGLYEDDARASWPVTHNVRAVSTRGEGHSE